MSYWITCPKCAKAAWTTLPKKCDCGTDMIHKPSRNMSTGSSEVDLDDLVAKTAARKAKMKSLPADRPALVARLIVATQNMSHEDKIGRLSSYFSIIDLQELVPQFEALEAEHGRR